MDDSTLFTLAMFAVTGLPILIIPLAVLLIGRAVRRGGAGGSALRSLPRPVVRFGCGLMLLVPVCAFGGVMVASVGGAIHPPVMTVAAPYVCDGTVESLSRNYSYRPGQQGVARNVFCIGADGSRRDISLRTIGAASIYYTLILLAAALVLGGLVRLLRPRRADKAQGVEDMAHYLAARLRTDSDIVRRTDARPGAGSVEERLQHLRSLRDAGLISEEEYQAKRAEIMSSL